MAKATKMTRKQVLWHIARVQHEVIRAHKAGLGEAERPWAKLLVGERNRLVAAVEADLSEPGDLGPLQRHNRWKRAKRAAGWRFGRKLNPKAKRHPLIKPYGELPRAQRCKAALAIVVLAALEPMLAEAEG